MKLPRIVSRTTATVIDHAPGADLLRSAAERAPGIAIAGALKAVQIGGQGYGLARRGAAAAYGVLKGDDEAPVAPVDDPWSGGPLHPVDDIREAAFLTTEDAAEVDAAPSGATLAHSELPLDDYDHLTLAELRARMRRLGVAELVQLREYEHAHADRLTVIKAFDNRLAALAKSSAEPEQLPAP